MIDNMYLNLPPSKIEYDLPSSEKDEDITNISLTFENYVLIKQGNDTIAIDRNNIQWLMDVLSDMGKVIEEREEKLKTTNQ